MSDVDAGIRAALGTRQALLEDAAGRAQAYLAKLAERRVAPGPEAVGALARLDFPLPASGRDPAQVLALLDDVGSPPRWRPRARGTSGSSTAGRCPWRRPPPG